jgi:predicted short-subunit dehydrogenase-like oxidoreductase (DUF2520 family)
MTLFFVTLQAIGFVVRSKTFIFVTEMDAMGKKTTKYFVLIIADEYFCVRSYAIFHPTCQYDDQT